jgi:hypothetical protein
VGHLTFLFPYQPEWSQVVHVFLARSWDGQAVESAEARPVWCSINAIPYARMWQDSAYWLPLILAGQQVRARFTFREDNESVAEMEMEEWPYNSHCDEAPSCPDLPSRPPFREARHDGASEERSD